MEESNIVAQGHHALGDDPFALSTRILSVAVASVGLVLAIQRGLWAGALPLFVLFGWTQTGTG
jgi:hypothetical protein